MKYKSIIFCWLARFPPKESTLYCVFNPLLRKYFSRFRHVLNVVNDRDRCIFKMMHSPLLATSVFLYEVFFFTLLYHLLLFPAQLHEISYLLLA